MDEIVYEALCRYYHVLELKGYVSFAEMMKLLVLVFYKDYVYNDFRGIIKTSDYHLIEKALDCLYGSTCLIPYPNYLKMGKLYLGEITELSERVQAIEDTRVVKLMYTMDDENSSDDVGTSENTSTSDEGPVIDNEDDEL